MAAEFDLKKVTRDWRSRDGGGLLLSLRAQPKTDNALTVVSEALSAAGGYVLAERDHRRAVRDREAEERLDR